MTTTGKEINNYLKKYKVLSANKYDKKLYINFQ